MSPTSYQAAPPRVSARKVFRNRGRVKLLTYAGSVFTTEFLPFAATTTSTSPPSLCSEEKSAQTNVAWNTTMPVHPLSIAKPRHFNARSAAILLLALLSTAACQDTSAPRSPATDALAIITCTGSIEGISCAPANSARNASSTPDGLALDRVLGGQNTYVQLAVTSNSFNSTTNQLSSGVTVRNLTTQPLGTSDGETPDVNGVRVFFHTQPTNGVTVVNASGSGSFTGSNQPYFRYDEIILPGGVTVTPKTWTFQLPSASTTFTFQVYVVGKQPNESAPVAIAGLKLELVTDANVPNGLVPLYLTAPPGDPRLFIVDARGKIRIFHNGAMQTPDFLNIESRVTFAGEQGLLSMAFDPLYAQNGYFYVYFTDVNGDIAIERYSSTPGAAVADPTPTPVITIPHPQHENHNGGLVMFGPDGYLYFATGDGGGGGDNAQDSSSPLGKLFRINVRSQPFTAEMYAKGLRNPFRFDFREFPSNPSRVDLYIADVGANTWEEINVAMNNPAGLNYGWNVQEGNHCLQTGLFCATPGFHPPSFTYDHSRGCSVSGGFAYRGSAIPWLRGQYLFADYCNWYLRSLIGDARTGFSEHLWSTQYIGYVLSFGEDGAGEQYMMTNLGSVWKIVSK